MLRSGALFTSLVLLPASAFATAFQIEARTEAQVSAIRAWRGTDAGSTVLLPRRRLVQYLGLNGYELIPKTALGFESSLRVFADLGLPRGEASRIDGMRSEDVDLLWANLVYKGDAFGLRIGRQLYTDVLDLMAFDGAWVRYVHRFGNVGFGAEVYAGLWVKAGSTLGSSVYQPDGIRESDLRRVAAEQVAPHGELEDIEPVIGAKLVVENLFGLSATLGFRQAWLSGLTDVRRIGAELKWSGLFGITALAGLDYDMLLARLANARFSVRTDREEFAVGLDYLRVSPVLSADSIFYYFAHAPRDEARARFDYYPVGPLRFYGQLVATIYGTNLNTDPAFLIVSTGSLPDAASPLSIGGGGGAAVRYGAFRVAGDLTIKAGYGGRQIWLDVNGGYAPPQGAFSAEARASVANITDQANAQLKGTYVGFQVYASYVLTRASRFSIVFEQNFGPATRSDTKLFLLFDLKAVL